MVELKLSRISQIEDRTLFEHNGTPSVAHTQNTDLFSLLSTYAHIHVCGGQLSAYGPLTLAVIVSIEGQVVVCPKTTTPHHSGSSRATVKSYQGSC